LLVEKGLKRDVHGVCSENVYSLKDTSHILLMAKLHT